MLIALHARRSAAAVEQFHRNHPKRPLIVALTGTDLYDDIGHDPQAQRSLELAARLIVLHGGATAELPRQHRAKVRVIHQSAVPPTERAQPLPDAFEVCVIGHLRAVKDPFRTAEAVRRGGLPATSRITVTHLGAVLDDEMARRAQQEAEVNPRYRWVGDVPRREAKRILARSRLLVLSSKMEGGANVVSEALACKVPILSSRIAGSVGLLGEDYPGYFSVGDTQGLANLLIRAETDESFYKLLNEHCAKRAYLVDPARERRAWQELLSEFGGLTARGVDTPLGQHYKALCPLRAGRFRAGG